MKISGNTEIKWFGINSETVEIRLISSKNEPKWLQKDNENSIVSFYIIIWYYTEIKMDRNKFGQYKGE